MCVYTCVYMPSRAATTSLPRRAFVACLYAGCATGSFYGFGIYGGAIQSSLGLSDASLANINTVPYALGFVSAPLAGRVTKAFGPAAGLLLGGAIQAALQVAMYAIATGAASTGAIDPGTALVLCACVVYVGGQLISSAAFSTPVLHFRRKRGRVVSLVKAFVGLSGAVVSQARLNLPPPRPYSAPPPLGSTPAVSRPYLGPFAPQPPPFGRRTWSPSACPPASRARCAAS